MHETSIVNSIIRTLELEFEAEKLKKLRSIHVKVGILSNIEPRLLDNAFGAYNYGGSAYEKVKLNIESTPIIIHCNDCNEDTMVEQYKFFCKKCQKPSKNVIQGEEMMIHKVEFED